MRAIIAPPIAVSASRSARIVHRTTAFQIARQAQPNNGYASPSVRKVPVSAAQGTSTAASAEIAAHARVAPAARASSQTGITVVAYDSTITTRATLNPSGEPKTSRQNASSQAFRRCTPRVYSSIAHSDDGRFSPIQWAVERNSNSSYCHAHMSNVQRVASSDNRTAEARTPNSQARSLALSSDRALTIVGGPRCRRLGSTGGRTGG